MNKNFIENAMALLDHRETVYQRFCARVLSFDGVIVTCSTVPCGVGSICSIVHNSGSSVTGEVVRVSDDRISIIPHDTTFPILVGQKVFLKDETQNIPVGPELLGRAFDGMGNPIDEGPLLNLTSKYNLSGKKLNPLERQPITAVFDVGVRNINSLMTIGKGQRLGIMAGSGVGKSVLLSMVAQKSSADVVVIALIGERGREVASFTKEIFTSHSKDKAVVIAVPADHSPLLRIQGAKRATAISEYFRDQGKDVLLIMDSLTRVAHAQRELGLALGEQPTARGYPPSVISLLPNLIERTGNSKASSGTITSIYTVLADGDDVTSDPVVDTARAILDGHIVLERTLAQQGVYPAIDVTKSISRIMNDICDENHIKNSKILRMLISKYQDNYDLLMMGGYVAGQDQDLDLAIRAWPSIVNFLMQSQKETSNFVDSREALNRLVASL